jgi:radical SAM superfamily enzyme YgiQ (UPF0313 family)
MRPPSEAESMLIRVMRGCPWNSKCAFCGAYRGTPFQGKKALRSPAEVNGDIDTLRAIADRANSVSWIMGHGGQVNREVLYDTMAVMAADGVVIDLFYLLWLSRYGNSPERAFLADSNPLVVRTDGLLEMLAHLYEAFPSLNRVTSYARAKTVVVKKPGELEALRQAGLTRLHLGLESGDDSVLKHMNKGATAEEMIAGGLKAKAAGFEVSEYVMPGLGGKAFSEQHAQGTVRVLNAVDPDYTRMRPLAVMPGTPLYQSYEDGEFELLTPRELLEEMRTMIEGLEITGRVCFDHANNPHTKGGYVFDLDHDGYKFPEEQRHVLALIDRALQTDGSTYPGVRTTL